MIIVSKGSEEILRNIFKEQSAHHKFSFELTGRDYDMQREKKGIFDALFTEYTNICLQNWEDTLGSYFSIPLSYSIQSGLTLPADIQAN